MATYFSMLLGGIVALALMIVFETRKESRNDRSHSKIP